MATIGFDTSNYTTSIAYYDGDLGINCSKLLPVKEGQLGLRQSDAVFHHTNSLPELSGRLFSQIETESISAIGVSTKPREVEGSYMPCFLVGISHSQLLADALKVPLIQVSHQQGHIASALWSANRLDLLDCAHLAWHLSGGTTELLLVEPENKNVKCTKIGGSTDISAGQLIDRTGILLGCRFPAGKELDKLSLDAEKTDFFKIKSLDLSFSLSGVQNKVMQYCESNSKEETAGYVLRCISDVVCRTTQDAIKKYPGLPVVFSGGVTANTMMRSVLSRVNPIFATPQYSTDNALGVAILAHRIGEGS